MEKRKVTVLVSVEIDTNKSDEDIIGGVKRGIYRGLDTEPYNIAAPKDVKINYCTIKE